MPKPSIWFFVVDEGRGRLFEGRTVPHGRPHLEERGSIENELEENEHGRPSRRAGKNGNSYASGGHPDDHLRRRFAKEVVAWIEHEVERLGIVEVGLFAPPRFLGEIRTLWGPALAARVVEHQAELTHLTPAGLAKHAAIAELLAAAAR